MIITVEDYDELQLLHFGVKGMKWGVRRDRRNARLASAGVKGGPTSAKVRAVVTGRIGLLSLAAGRGNVRKAAAWKSGRQGARNARVKAGTATARDQIIRFGSTRVSDLIPVREKNIGKKTLLDNHALVLAGVGALFAAKVLAKQAAKRAA